MIKDSGTITGNIMIVSDSQINVDRLKASPNRFPIHIARKLLNILVSVSQMKAKIYHIDGKHNPADVYSRGCTPDDYLKKECWHINMNDVMKYCSEPITTKMICMVNTSGDSSLEMWMSKLNNLHKMNKWINRILNWENKALPKKFNKLTSFEIVCRIYQQSKRVIPDNCISENGLLYFRSRKVNEKSIWIAGDSTLANLLLINAQSMETNMKDM